MNTKICVITDSAAGLTIEDLQRKNVLLCPTIIEDRDNNQSIYDDPRKFSKEQFLNLIKNSKTSLKTSQSPTGFIIETWDKALLEFNHIIYIPISNGLSKQYEAACIIAKEKKYKNKITIIKSTSASIVNRLMAIKAAEMIDEHEKLDTIISTLEKINQNQETLVIPYDISYLAAGGRISKTAATVANTLKIKPIIKLDVTMEKISSTRTFKKAVLKAMQLLLETKAKEKITLFYIIYGFIDLELKKDIDDCLKILDLTSLNIKYDELSNILSTHTGLNTLGLVAFDIPLNNFPKSLS